MVSYETGLSREISSIPSAATLLAGTVQGAVMRRPDERGKADRKKVAPFQRQGKRLQPCSGACGRVRRNNAMTRRESCLLMP